MNMWVLPTSHESEESRSGVGCWLLLAAGCGLLAAGRSRGRGGCSDAMRCGGGAVAVILLRL